ncbi:MAG: hypothetical protein ACREFQ_00210 [Stellaceae bacterium]
MASAPPISIGQRFRDIQLRNFGRPGLEWVVRDVITGTDGIAYARLACADDPTRLKTLSFAVLSDRHRFQRLDR